MIDKCCYNKELCCLMKCPIHSTKEIMPLTGESSNANYEQKNRDKFCIAGKICTDENKSLFNICNKERKKNELKINFFNEDRAVKFSDNLKNEFHISSSARQSVNKTEDEDKYDKLLSIWNITSNRSKIKSELGKLKSEIQVNNTFEEINESKSVIGSCTSVSFTNSPPKHRVLTSKDSIQVGSFVQKFENVEVSENSLHDSSLFDSNVKFGIVYTCSFCEYVFSNKYALAKHKRKHNFCQYCKAKFKSFEAVTNHKKMCIFEKCMTSRPRVNLINIALSKNMRKLYKPAFEVGKFPTIDSRSGLKSKNHDMLKCDSSFDNVTVKSEPIDFVYDETQNFSGNNSHNNYHDSMETSIKSEVMDICEEHIFFDEPCLNHIKEEDIILKESTNLSSVNCPISIENSNLLDANIVEEPVNNNIAHMFNCKKLKHQTVETYFSENEECQKVPRFSRFKSELEEMSETGEEDSIINGFSGKDHCIPIKKHELDNTFFMNNSESSLNDVCKTEEKQKVEDQVKIEVPDICRSTEVHMIKSDSCLKLKDQKANSRPFSSEHANIKTKLEISSKLVSEKNVVKSIKLENENSKLKLNIAKATSPKNSVVYDLRKAHIPTKVKYIRLTNKPNLSLFVF